MSRSRELAKANNLDPSAKLKLGMKLTVPGARRLRCPAAQPGGRCRRAARGPLAPPATKMAAVTADRQQKARLAQAAPTAEDAAAETPVKAAEATGALPTFRWPVRGKVITAYGAKTNGKANDGINLAVPEGTPVKAAEDGVVAYSGNELKGYGNLVLVRHANGYVTAYAHASELLVKRGDTIKRGQVIAKSGQSGEVDRRSCTSRSARARRRSTRFNSSTGREVQSASSPRKRRSSIPEYGD